MSYYNKSSVESKQCIVHFHFLSSGALRELNKHLLNAPMRRLFKKDEWLVPQKQDGYYRAKNNLVCPALCRKTGINCTSYFKTLI